MIAVVSTPAMGQVHRWIDKDGTIHFTDNPTIAGSGQSKTISGEPEPTPPYEMTGSNLRDFGCGIFYGMGYFSAIYKQDPFGFKPSDPQMAQPCYDAGYTYGVRYQKAQEKRNNRK